jgi:hypothetical protein
MRHRNDWWLSSRFDQQVAFPFGGQHVMEHVEDLFSLWLNKQLEHLEQRHQDSRPRGLSIIVVIIS